MVKDKWYQIVNDDIDDIPLRVEQLKSEYWRIAWPLMFVVVLGTSIMGVANTSGIIAIGCFMSITGMLGILAMAIMSHHQLCLYRLVKEIRNQDSIPESVD